LQVGRAVFVAALTLFNAPCWAISGGQLDDFNDATSQGWGFNNGLDPVFVAEHEGPNGEDDHSILMSTIFSGHPRLLVMNVAQWTGDWTGEGIVQVSLDVRNPNAFDLSMRLGIAGPGGHGQGGFGDTHVTDAIVVPDDNVWHSLTFDVLASDFTAISGNNTAVALADVTQLRVIHNPNVQFVGEMVEGDFYLDNIQAIAAPGELVGDFNADDVVDAADYVVWRKHNGTSYSLPNDGGLGVPIGAGHFNLWRANFGNMPTGAGASQTPAAAPEPASAMIVLLALFLAACVRC
jgi:hypothetical protein